MLARILITTGLVSAGLLLILLTTTTPTSAGAFGILALFLLSYVFILSITTFVLKALVYLMNRTSSSIRRPTHSANGMTLKKAYYYSTVIALGPVIVVSLRSVGSVGVYELGLVVLFITLGCLYVARRAA